MKRLRAVALLAALLPAAVAAQSDSVVVTVIDRATINLTITTTSAGGGFGIPLTGAVGDTLTFQAVAIDVQTGDTIAVILRWESSSAAVVIDAVTGWARYVGDCGQAVCHATISAFVREIVSIAVFREHPDGTWGEVFTVERQPVYAARGFAPDSLTLGVGEVVQLCAYLADVAGVWFRDAETCPPGLPADVGPLPLGVRLGAVLAFNVDVSHARVAHVRVTRPRVREGTTGE